MSRKSSMTILIALTIIWAAALAVVASYNFDYSIFYVFPFCFILILFYGQIYKNYNLSHIRSSDCWMPLMVTLIILVAATAIVYTVYQVEFILMVIILDIALIFAMAFRLSDRIKDIGSPSKKWFLAVTALMVVVYICFLILPEICSSFALLQIWSLLIILIVYSASLQALPN